MPDVTPTPSEPVSPQPWMTETANEVVFGKPRPESAAHIDEWTKRDAIAATIAKHAPPAQSAPGLGDGVDPERPETWPTEPPKEPGDYFAAEGADDEPFMASRCVDGTWWRFFDYQYEDAEMPLSRDEADVRAAGWRFLPIPITPAALSRQPSSPADEELAVADEVLRLEELVRTEMGHYDAFIVACGHAAPKLARALRARAGGRTA